MFSKKIMRYIFTYLLHFYEIELEASDSWMNFFIKFSADMMEFSVILRLDFSSGHDARVLQCHSFRIENDDISGHTVGLLVIRARANTSKNFTQLFQAAKGMLDSRKKIGR